MARITIASSGPEGVAAAPSRDRHIGLCVTPGPGTDDPFALLLTNCYSSEEVNQTATAATTAQPVGTTGVFLPTAGAVKLVTMIVPRDAADSELLASVFPPPLRVTFAPDAQAEERSREAGLRADMRWKAACVYSCVSVGGAALTVSEMALSPLLKDAVVPARKLQILQARERGELWARAQRIYPPRCCLAAPCCCFPQVTSTRDKTSFQLQTVAGMSLPGLYVCPRRRLSRRAWTSDGPGAFGRSTAQPLRCSSPSLR